MENCSFCGSVIPFGTGKMFVKKDARILYFCSRRCEKNLLWLKRIPRETGFTAAAKVAKKQHLSELAHAKEPVKEEAPVKKPAKKAPKKKVAA